MTNNFTNRGFLSETGLQAYAVEVGVSPEYVSSEMQIGDYDGTVYIDFSYLTNKEGYEAAIAKIDKLIDVLQAIKSHMPEPEENNVN